MINVLLTGISITVNIPVVDKGRPEVGCILETGGRLPGRVQYLSSMVKLDSRSASASFSNSAHCKTRCFVQ